MCLQGGAEFGPACGRMDTEVLRRADGPAAVVALAAAPGHEHRTAAENGVRHLRALGAEDVVSVPDAREDPEAAHEALQRARLVVLPGGSPSRLLEALRSTGIDRVLTALLASGGVLSGSSAGAMVLGGWTVLPDRPGPAVVPALGLVPDVVVLPHWSGSGRADWVTAIEGAVPERAVLLGVPEQSGVLVEDGVLTGVGERPTALLRTGGLIEVGRSWSPRTAGP